MAQRNVLKKIKGIQLTKPSDLVIKQFQELLERNELRPGDVLPSEVVLAKTFGIGRSHVRDAIKVLQFYGIFKPLQGVGTVVTNTGIDSISGIIRKMVRFEPRDYQELVAARALIEPFNAHHAAVNATEEELKKIQAILAKMDKNVKSNILDVELECSLHLEIAKAAHNRVLENTIYAILPGLMTLLNEMDLAQGGRNKNSNLEHHQLVDAIVRHDPAMAEDAMRRHMVNGGAHFTVHIANIASDTTSEHPAQA